MASKTTDRPTGAKDIYLLMRPELIRATLKGKKGQTRRLVKPDHIWWSQGCHPDRDWKSIGSFRDGRAFLGQYPGVSLGELTAPYGKPGDLAVVRESVGCNDEYPVQQSMQLFRGKGAGLPNGPLAPQQLEFWQKYVVYRASTPEPPYLVNGWRSPLHMPRWAARIVRPIIEIKVERVADISEADAEAEGVYHDYNLGELARYRIRWPHLSTGQCLYRALWNEINAKPKPRYGREGDKKVITHYEAFPWSVEDFDALYPGAREAGAWKSKPLTVYPNPWVWVVSYERREEVAR